MCLIDVGNVKDADFAKLSLAATGLLLKLRLWASKRETENVDLSRFCEVLGLVRRDVDGVASELVSAGFVLLEEDEAILPAAGVRVVHRDPRMLEWVRWWTGLRSAGVVNVAAPVDSDPLLVKSWVEALSGPNAALVVRDSVMADLEYEIREASAYLSTRRWFNLPALFSGFAHDRRSCMQKLLAGDYRPNAEPASSESAQSDMSKFVGVWWRWLQSESVIAWVDAALNNPASLLKGGSHSTDELVEAKREALARLEEKTDAIVLDALKLSGGWSALLKRGDDLSHTARNFKSNLRDLYYERNRTGDGSVGKTA